MSPVAETSEQAYHEIRDSLPDSRRAVLEAIASAPGGLTLYEVARKLGRPEHTISGRITELKKAGLVIDSGIRRINPASNKGAAVVAARLKSTLF